MSKLLPPNATKLEKNIEQLGEKISNLPVPFVDLHRIDRCPVAHLPWLAWQHRVEYWQPEWSEPEKRNAISESEAFNAQRGTRSSITSLLSTVVENFQLKAWHEFQPPQQPFTFVVMISTQHLLSIEQLLQVQTAIDATKSARDNYSITAKVKTNCDFYVTGSITTGTFVRLSSYTDQNSYYWQLDTTVNINQDIATYTAMSSDGFDDYSSFADLNLTDAIIRSFHDTDMQQWQAVKDAANELTGVSDWIIDLANNQIVYTVATLDYCTDASGLPPHVINGYRHVGGVLIGRIYFTGDAACSAYNAAEGGGWWGGTRFNGGYGCIGISSGTLIAALGIVANPNYDSDAVPETVNIPFASLAQKIISNTSSSNQAISLLAEAYLENVAKSIFAADESKQFVRMADLIEKFEQNKIIIN